MLHSDCVRGKPLMVLIRKRIGGCDEENINVCDSLYAAS